MHPSLPILSRSAKILCAATRALTLAALGFASAVEAAQGETPDGFSSLSRYTYGESRTNLAVLEALVREAAGNPARAMELELRFLTVLNGEATPEAKEFICRQLRLLGTDMSVPALGRLLADARLSHMARYALESNPSLGAAGALRQSLWSLHGDRLVGVIHGLGERRDVGAVPGLGNHLRSKDPRVVQVTLSALGKIGNAPALDLIRAVAANYDPAGFPTVPVPVPLSDEVRLRLDPGAVADALLRCAEAHQREGRTEAALELYHRVQAFPPSPRPTQLAALAGLVRLAPEKATPEVLRLLRSEDPSAQRAAAGLLRGLPTDALLQMAPWLEALPPAQQASLVNALAERKHPSIPAILLKAAQHRDPLVRSAALRVLTEAPVDPGFILLLLKLAATEPWPEPPGILSARQSLQHLPRAEVHRVLLEHLRAGEPALRAEALRILVAQQAPEAPAALVQALTDPDPSLRTAALDALPPESPASLYPTVTHRLFEAASDEERQAAVRAVRTVSAQIPEVELRSKPLVDGFTRASIPAQLAVLACLGQWGGTGALGATVEATRHADVTVQVAAIRALSAWPDVSALEELMVVARERSDRAQRTLALEGCARLIAQPSGRRLTQSLELYRQALALVRQPEDAHALLEQLARVPHPDTLKLVEPFLQKGESRDVAAAALLGVARGLLGSYPTEARQALAKISASSPPPTLEVQVQPLRLELGRAEGWASAAMLAGPFAGSAPTETGLLEEPFPPEQPGAVASWTPLIAEGGTFRLPTPASTSRGPPVVYLRCAVTLSERTQVRFEIETDAACKVWLNEAVLHRQARSAAGENGASLRPPTARLEAGSHTLLLKLTPIEGPGRIRLRARAPDGTAITALRLAAE